MADAPVETTTQAERPLTDAELATSWLNHRKGVVSKELEQTERRLDFNRGYKPSPKGPMPSWMEQGGLDMADWKAEVMQTHNGKMSVMMLLTLRNEKYIGLRRNYGLSKTIWMI